MRRSPAALLIFVALKYAMGLRVSEEERMGLDLGEHGMEAYASSCTRCDRRSTGPARAGGRAPALKVNPGTAQSE